MIDSRIVGNKVFFSNGHHCGDIEWDDSWREYYFVPTEGTRFSPGWLVDIAKNIQGIRRKE